MKQYILAAIIALIFGTASVIGGFFLNISSLSTGNTAIFMGLGINFAGTVLLVMGLHQRKRRH